MLPATTLYRREKLICWSQLLLFGEKILVCIKTLLLLYNTTKKKGNCDIQRKCTVVENRGVCYNFIIIFLSERGIAFVINATSEVAEMSFQLMQATIKLVMNRYGLKNVKFHVITRGEDKIHFDSNLSDLTALKRAVDKLEGGSEGIPALHKDLEKAVSAFENECVSTSKKVS